MVPQQRAYAFVGVQLQDDEAGRANDSAGGHQPGAAAARGKERQQPRDTQLQQREGRGRLSHCRPAAGRSARGKGHEGRRLRGQREERAHHEEPAQARKDKEGGEEQEVRLPDTVALQRRHRAAEEDQLQERPSDHERNGRLWRGQLRQGRLRQPADVQQRHRQQRPRRLRLNRAGQGTRRKDSQRVAQHGREEDEPGRKRHA